MLVCVTGGTGIVGAHSIAAVVAAGHRVRVLVRPTSLPLRALDALGVDVSLLDVTVGDVTDEAAVRAAVRDADAVLHSASVYSFDPRRRSEIRVTGRALPAVFLPARPMLPLGRLAGVLQRFWPWHIPAEYGAIYTCATAVPVDATAGTEFAATVADTVRWLLATGRLSVRAAGRAALSEVDDKALSDQGGQRP